MGKKHKKDKDGDRDQKQGKDKKHGDKHAKHGRDGRPPRMKRALYEEKLAELHLELVKMQYWVRATGQRVVILFEGRDAAGKGGAIKCISEPLNPRGCRIVALNRPSDTEKSQWYFQRYIAQLPAGGEIALFDRSWYNRAVVEHVMGFCTKRDYEEFLRFCPEFEKGLVRSGITLLKYWFSVSDEEQDRRFRERVGNPARRWKLSDMDIACREKWVEFSKAKDEMFKETSTKTSPWYTVEADDKRRARLNCIAHILSQVPYQDATPPPLELPPRKHHDDHYVRPPRSEQNPVPDYFE